MTEDKATKKKEKQAPTGMMPTILVRDTVIFPYMVVPLYVGRESSVRGIEVALKGDKTVFLVSQKDADLELPKRKDIYNVGVVGTLLQTLRLPDGSVKVLVEGLHRATIKSLKKTRGYWEVSADPIDEVEKGGVDRSTQALMKKALSLFESLIDANGKVPAEVLANMLAIEAPGRLADTIAAHLTIPVESRQEMLECDDIQLRLGLLVNFLSQELELAELEKNVQVRVKEQVEKSQKQFYLSEKMKAIQQELGELDESISVDEHQELMDQINKSGMSAEAKEKAMAELKKLQMMPPMSAEATVCRNYLDCLLDVPWKKKTKISKDIVKAEKVLNEAHYGLEEVKKRILEYLAVEVRVKKFKGPILCLVGPPGVGKTSLGQSIADATGRAFIRVSLGGIHDEAEIRGHRRTYIGAMPGKIIQKITKSKVKNPLFMLDEVDKMAKDFRGDPASALLEVLDPEQNNMFNDHFLEVDYDLSDVMFIATSNSMDIPAPLLDRMEVIRLAGYTEEEKLRIAEKYLLPRQMKNHGVNKKELVITRAAIRRIISQYTRESGVRSLERCFSKICRKVVRSLLLPDAKSTYHIEPNDLETYLGVHIYRRSEVADVDRVGQVAGLAWTEVGGELLPIEAEVLSGQGKLVQTGYLGEVMQESIQAAMTVVRRLAPAFSVPKSAFTKNDCHVHVPEGATPKDGPSAGVGMCTALMSALTKIPVRADLAMTGEITLHGEVLPIGGLKEKLLAALRGGIKHVLIPEDNYRELKEIPKVVTKGLHIYPVKWISEVLALALVEIPPTFSRITRLQEGASLSELRALRRQLRSAPDKPTIEEQEGVSKKPRSKKAVQKKKKLVQKKKAAVKKKKAPVKRSSTKKVSSKKASKKSSIKKKKTGVKRSS